MKGGRGGKALPMNRCLLFVYLRRPPPHIRKLIKGKNTVRCITLINKDSYVLFCVLDENC